MTVFLCLVVVLLFAFWGIRTYQKNQQSKKIAVDLRAWHYQIANELPQTMRKSWLAVSEQHSILLLRACSIENKVSKNDE
ncbi:MAG: hypothetical protein MJH11_13610 [Lentisphaeria bacterium]|nr:hypothetical protein [Lentisphaeria bacterium]